MYNSKYTGAQVEALLDSIPELKETLEGIEVKFGLLVKGEGTMTGDGVGNSTIKTKIVSNIPSGVSLKYKLVAVTDITYTSADGKAHTFVDVYWINTGATTGGGIISELRGNVGDSIPNGTVIHEGVFQPASDVDIYIRGRFSGIVKLECSYRTY